MTNEEFSNEFDTLINSFSETLPFGKASSPLKFDEYEKSIFLTKAQESVVISLYNGKLLGDSFEKTEELRRYLSNLVKTFSTEEKIKGEGLTEKSVFFNIPEDTWFITYESVISDDNKLGCAKGSVLEVVPVTQDELYKTYRNPFRTTNKRRVLRLDTESYKVELISQYDISRYQIRYITKPDPIILIDLPDGLSINGDINNPEKGTKKTECKLNPALHRMILDMAVQLAIQSKAGK